MLLQGKLAVVKNLWQYKCEEVLILLVSSPMILSLQVFSWAWKIFKGQWEIFEIEASPK